MAKRVLLIAYHFPPVRGSSGLQRTLKFASYLPSFGWEPQVLTISPKAYEWVGDDQLKDVPAGLVVERAFGLDTARHLAIAGRYPGFLANPDRWATWWWGGVSRGMKMIRDFRPDAIWSTFPIPTAHKIGLTLAQRSGLPWIADFRDSMTEDNHPADPVIRARLRRLESDVVHTCSKAVFTTPGAIRMYEERYPDVDESRWGLIPNGFDEDNFREADALKQPAEPGRPLTLVHSGILYPSERDPREFFSALRALKSDGTADKSKLRVVLRATAHDAYYQPMLAEYGIEDLVELAPSVPYRDALSEMMNADGLLLFQASNCNHQVPAKLYEYFRAGRPILGLTDPVGDTATTMTSAGVDSIAPLDDAEAISVMLRRFMAGETFPVVAPDAAEQHSRRGRTALLAELLNELSG